MHADLKVRVIPRAARDTLAGERAGALLVRTTAPPLDGRANAAVCRLLARAAGVSPARVSIVRGAAAREKVVRIEGLTEVELRRALDLP